MNTFHWLLRALIVLVSFTPLTASALELRVLSYNVWGIKYIAPERAERLDEIGTRVARLAPDLVAFQEVWLPDDVERFRPQLESAGLEHYHYFGDYQESSGLWVASRFPISRVDFVEFALGRKMSIPWHVDYMAQKGVGIIRVETPLGPVELANTHLQSSYVVGDYRYVQFDQALQAADRLRGDLDELVAPVIAVGDWNVTPSSLQFRVLCSRSGLEPAADDFGIEAILSRSGSALRLVPLSVERVLGEKVMMPSGERRTLSDHPAILATYELQPCDGCLPATVGLKGPLGDEALRFIDDATESAERMMMFDRVLTVSLPLLGIVIALRFRRLATRARRALRCSVVVMLFAAAGWLAYLGWDFDPYKLDVLAQQRAEILERR